MVKTQLLLLGLCCALQVPAQVSRLPITIGSTKVSAYSNRFSDVFSFTANQGALGAQRQFAAGVYSEQRFLLKALTTYAAALALPTTSGNFGFCGTYSGDAAYHESSAGLAYGRNLGSKVAVGVQFNWYALNASGYGSASTINFEAGAVVHLTPQLNTGLHVYNPVGRRWGKDGAEKLPAIYTAGLGYEASDQVFAGAELENVEGQSLGVNACLHYRFAETLVARVGVQSATAAFYLGFGLFVKRLHINVTSSFHPQLGLTPGLLLMYSKPQ